MEQMDKPTHKHTHLQFAQANRTKPKLQKSVLLANAQPTNNQNNREKGQQITLSRIYKSPPQISQIKSQRLIRLLNIRCSARPDEGLYFS